MKEQSATAPYTSEEFAVESYGFMNAELASRKKDKILAEFVSTKTCTMTSSHI